MFQTRGKIKMKKHFSQKPIPRGFRKRLFAEEKTEGTEPVEEAETDAKVTLAGMLDPAKVDDGVVNAFAEACAVTVEQAKQLVSVVEDANAEGAEAQASFSKAKYNSQIKEASLKFSRKSRAILNRHFADEKTEEEKALDGEVLAKDVAIILKAMDDNTFIVKTPEELSATIETATELPMETSLALIELKNNPLPQQEQEVEKKEENEGEEQVSTESELSTFARHKRLQKIRQAFAKKKGSKKTVKKCASRKELPVVSLDMREAVKPLKGDKKMKHLTDNLEEVRAFSRRKHFAEMLRRKRLAKSKKFADPDDFEPREIGSQDPDKPVVARRSDRPHGQLNSTLAGRLRSTKQSDATKARDTSGRIEDLSAVNAGESLAELNEMVTCPNSRFARHNRFARTRKQDDEFRTLRELLGDNFKE